MSYYKYIRDSKYFVNSDCYFSLLSSKVDMYQLSACILFISKLWHVLYLIRKYFALFMLRKFWHVLYPVGYGPM